MKIPVCLDATSLQYSRGVARYTRNLIKQLVQRPELEIYLYGASWGSYSQLKTAFKEFRLPTSQVVIDHLPHRFLPKFWSVGSRLPYRHAPTNAIFHGWEWQLPPLQPAQNLVVTIHDLAMLRLPELVHPEVLAHHQRVWQVLKTQPASIVAVSETTKQDLIELLAIPPHKISVVPEALPEEFRLVSQTLGQDEYETIKTQLKLNQPFILFVGTLEPRKNLPRLIDAWLPLANDYQLVIAGETGWEQNLPDHQQIRRLGSVSDQQLAVLYAEAAAFAFPSLYEGFGLPILEAFHHGTPVVTSDNSGMKEVAGNAAVLVDPFSVESIRSGLEQILNENLEQQQLRLKRMIIRQQMFSWTLAAQQMVRVYQQAWQS